ncbi:hypothetical protein BC792_103134 [Sphingobacterium allocomposti]|uniref:Phosphoribosylpyrophosphate synthetase n=1 Tax=Sphingobacterium allocomposti TaxID=415956 RepID=A0A5S5DPB5_9SPHI|nr:hypothetical protein [Sphingobacterium composti Yoo et al. 2007 non Ten et al. 2007]TYP97208.1 hypothetical protein BC792_103134 [Sphingobacterium composti Yoo et al. 2007 non Ten et al. 2007]
METKHNYETADVALAKLQEMGYTVDFNVEFDEVLRDADDYQIDHLYRYEGPSNPDDESTVYGISNQKTGKKGVFVAGNLSWIEGKKRDIILNLELKYKNKDNQ